MRNLWNETEARKCGGDPLALRVYTSRLLGREAALVLHGGGNTSVKAKAVNLFGEEEDILYVKGSGWDLATIEAEGFAPVELDVLRRMAQLKRLSDADMVKGQRCAMTDPGAPTPSVEAILHAIIPFTFVDHTHADAVVTITNTPGGEKRIRQIYGRRVLIVPYVMPGFVLAKKVYTMTRGIDWQSLEGMVLLNHGIFTFADDAKTSYLRMIRLVAKAEEYLKKKRAVISFSSARGKENLLQLAKIRRAVSCVRGSAVIARWNAGKREVYFANHPRAAVIAARGPLTPDHVIRTKRTPVVLGRNPVRDVGRFEKEYQAYFKRHFRPGLKVLDAAPRWAVWPGYGTIAFGAAWDEAQIISDINEHTMDAILKAQKLGGWQALPEKDIFEVEYWDLEQAKLKKNARAAVFQGKIALVTGAAGGIGKACVEALAANGAAVAALDVDPAVTRLFSQPQILGIICDLTKSGDIEKAVSAAIRRFGGLDILVSNAGRFPSSAPIADMNPAVWQKSLDVNLTSHQFLMKTCIPYLSLGIDPAVVVIASKNVPAPGPGAAAYSVAKAGLTQLARVAALELAGKGIRVNIVHPNQVFDTAIWTPEVLAARAKSYHMSVAEYKISNLLKTEITSRDVAGLVCAMAGPVFGKTTGAQVPIDGGNERVI